MEMRGVKGCRNENAALPRGTSPEREALPYRSASDGEAVPWIADGMEVLEDGSDDE